MGEATERCPAIFHGFLVPGEGWRVGLETVPRSMPREAD